MNSLTDQLIAAYQDEQRLYLHIRELVAEQARIMDAQPDPAAVLALCNQVEGLMRDVAVIERAIEPAKVAWSETRHDPDGALDRTLAAIQTLIEETAADQERVQERLMALVRRQRETARNARASVNANRARTAYGSAPVEAETAAS